MKFLKRLIRISYLQLTAGLPDPGKYLEWVRLMLPRAAYGIDEPATPEDINDFLLRLQEKQVECDLAGNVIDRFRFPDNRELRPISMERLLEHLWRLRITYRERSFPIRFWKLKTCPVCERATAGTYLLQNGTIRCFSTNCSAYSGNGGLPASKWAPEDVIEYLAETPIEPTQTEFIELSAAERLITERLKKDVDKAIAVTPGVGKTRLGVLEASLSARQGIILYAFPNHRLATEWVAKAKAMANGGPPIIRLAGRREEHPTTCYNYRKVRTAAYRGFSPAFVVCPRCEYFSGKAKENDDTCPYYRQFSQIKESGKGLVFCTTAQLPSLLAREEFGKIHSVIIDEQPLAAMLHYGTPLGLGELQSLIPHLSWDAAKMLERIKEKAESLHKQVDK